VSRGTWEPVPESQPPFAYRTITLYGGPFQALRLDGWLVTLRDDGNRLQTGPATP
jgi:cytochrome c-type biogenesis protein CcmH/NrfF